MGAPAYIPKPSKFQRDAAKWERGRARDKAKRAEELAEKKAWDALTLDAYNRDHGCSRLSWRPLEYRTQNPFTVADPHHIKWRSAGGLDVLENIVTISREEHDMIHMRGNYKFRIEVEGNANKTLTCRKFSMETGRLVREWESPCPS